MTERFVIGFAFLIIAIVEFVVSRARSSVGRREQRVAQEDRFVVESREAREKSFVVAK